MVVYKLDHILIKQSLVLTLLYYGDYKRLNVTDFFFLHFSDLYCQCFL